MVGRGHARGAKEAVAEFQLRGVQGAARVATSGEIAYWSVPQSIVELNSGVL